MRAMHGTGRRAWSCGRVRHRAPAGRAGEADGAARRTAARSRGASGAGGRWPARGERVALRRVAGRGSAARAAHAARPGKRRATPRTAAADGRRAGRNSRSGRNACPMENRTTNRTTNRATPAIARAPRACWRLPSRSARPAGRHRCGSAQLRDQRRDEREREQPEPRGGPGLPSARGVCRRAMNQALRVPHGRTANGRSTRPRRSSRPSAGRRCRAARFRDPAAHRRRAAFARRRPQLASRAALPPHHGARDGHRGGFERQRRADDLVRGSK